MNRHPGEVGELVLTEPLPSMPLGFWGDASGERYRASYYADFPGVWRHGDWIMCLPDGGCVISGRSDATLNRGGVRVGTSDFYRVVEEPRHVPDEIRQVPGIPRTISGKKVEVPVRKILTGTPISAAVDPSSLANPEVLGYFTPPEG